LSKIYKYYVGSKGPQIYYSENGELPFRVEEIEEKDVHQTDGLVRDVALNFLSGVVGSGGNIEGTISAGDYATHRAVHFNAFNIAGDLL